MNTKLSDVKGYCAVTVTQSTANECLNGNMGRLTAVVWNENDNDDPVSALIDDQLRLRTRARLRACTDHSRKLG